MSTGAFKGASLFSFESCSWLEDHLNSKAVASPHLLSPFYILTISFCCPHFSSVLCCLLFIAHGWWNCFIIQLSSFLCADYRLLFPHPLSGNFNVLNNSFNTAYVTIVIFSFANLLLSISYNCISKTLCTNSPSILWNSASNFTCSY